MKLIVMSDSHGACDAVLTIVKKHLDDADMFIHLGDGANDIAVVREKYPSLNIKNVCGNCDFSSSLENEMEFTVLNKKIFITHGNRYDVKTDLNSLYFTGKEINADIVLYGHTHLAQIEYSNGMYLINPGSVRMGYFGEQTYATITINENGILPNIVKI